MKRLAVLAGLLLVGAITLMAAQQPQQPATLEIQKVKDNLYMITGGGGNTAAFITEKGVVVVDTKLPNNGPSILEKIKIGHSQTRDDGHQYAYARRPRGE